MSISGKEKNYPSNRRTPREEEQLLCNEALRTGAFDSISDSEWIALCERAADKGRTASKSDLIETNTAVR